MLYLRKLDHPQTADHYRVILKTDETEYEIGSIGTKFFAQSDPVWTWGIDTIIPMRQLESEGRGADRRGCMMAFKAAWQKFAADPARLTEFLEVKRRAKRSAP